MAGRSTARRSVGPSEGEGVATSGSGPFPTSSARLGSKLRRRRDDSLQALLELLAAGGSFNLPGNLVRLDLFALTVGKNSRSIGNDLTSRDLLRRQRWPEFRKAGGVWVTTSDRIRTWLDEQRSSRYDPVVEARLGRKIRRIG